MSNRAAVKLTHNLDGNSFMWLWAKYVRAVNDEQHCQASLRGPYSKRLSGHNTDLPKQATLMLDEVGQSEFRAIYICGVARKGYSAKKNYPFNLHAAILPKAGAKGVFAFNGWELNVENGMFLPIPQQQDLPARYQGLPPQYTTCRIFRWAVCAVGRVAGIELS